MIVLRESKKTERIPLNMAANTFLCIRTRRWNYVIRMGWRLKERIDPQRLRQAVEDIRPRFPSFFVAARRGFLSYHLECMDFTDNIVQEEGDYFCRPFDLFSKTAPMIRVVYEGCRFAVEIPHAVADGKGLTVFTRALLARYLDLDDLIDLSEPPRAEELRDDYRNFCRETKGKIPKDSAAWQYRRPYVENYLKVIHGAIPLEDILTAAKARGMSVTEYLMCAYLYAFYLADPSARSSQKPIKLRIPVNMRQFYPSETLHNFTLYRNLGFVPGEKEEWSFEDVLDAMRGILKPCTTPEAMTGLLNQTVTLSGNPILRIIPIGLKRWFFKLGYYLTGEKPMTGVLSNLGRVELPPHIAEHVESVEFIMGGTIYKSLCAFVLSDHRSLHIYLSGACKSTDVQDELFCLLQREGLHVSVEWTGSA